MNMYYNTLVDWWFYSVVSSLAVLFTILYYYSTSTYDQLRKQNVPHPPPVPLFGNVFKMMILQENMHVTFRKIYRTFASDKICGFYQMRTPYLMIRDPVLIYTIMNKDFDYFFDRGFKMDPSINLLARSLFSAEGQKWKTMRRHLNVGFTSAKIKSMQNQMAECSDRLLKWIDEKSKVTDGIEVSEITGNFATDVIGTCAFGLNLDNIDENVSDFRKHTSDLSGDPDIRQALAYILPLMFPTICKVLKFFLPLPEASKFFYSVFSNAIEYRTKNNVVKHDLTQTLINARKKLVLEGDNSSVDENDKFTDLDIISNAVLLFSAGAETVSITTALCLQELALNKDIQNRLRDEINTTKAKYDGQFSDEYYMDLPYLKMVINETHRKYSVAISIFREATKDYTVPGIESFTIKKGQKILIPMDSIHQEPLYYPDPHIFDPERFSKEEIARRPNGSFIPFGLGPRQCIGMRFAELELKMVLSKILTKFEIFPCEKTDYSLDLKLKFGFISPKNGVWLKFIPIEN